MYPSEDRMWSGVSDLSVFPTVNIVSDNGQVVDVCGEDETCQKTSVYHVQQLTSYLEEPNQESINLLLQYAIEIDVTIQYYDEADGVWQLILVQCHTDSGGCEDYADVTFYKVYIIMESGCQT